MTREKWKERLPIVQAFADGKAVQFKHPNGDWIDAEDLSFDGYSTEYRIKPEPREFYVHPKCGKCHEFKVLPPHPDEGWIKVREVLE